MSRRALVIWLEVITWGDPFLLPVWQHTYYNFTCDALRVLINLRGGGKVREKGFDKRSKLINQKVPIQDTRRKSNANRYTSGSETRIIREVWMGAAGADLSCSRCATPGDAPDEEERRGDRLACRKFRARARCADVTQSYTCAPSVHEVCMECARM